MAERRGAIRDALLTLAFLVGFVSLILWRMHPPLPRALTASPAEFSARRALAHLQQIARAPHFTGSLEQTRVRAYLIEQLRQLGLKVEVQEGIAARPAQGAISAGLLHNILGTLPASRSTGAKTPALLLVAHYDSVASGPGAGDDGAAVAALLETVQALKVHAPFRNDIVVLFTDGEERGLLGAELFVREHPLRQRVGVVLNFEARGGSGPVYLFETSDGNSGQGNAALIRHYAASVRHPAASSLAYALYKLLPNDTDLTIFREKGLSGLNFAFIDNITQYHTALDTPENLDLRSLQHHGEIQLSLARRLGNADLTKTGGGDTVFFDPLNLGLIVYPVAWVVPLTVAAGLYFLFVLVRLFQAARNRSIGGLLAGFVTAGLLPVVSSAIVMLLWQTAIRLFPAIGATPWLRPYGWMTIAAGVSLLWLFLWLLMNSLGRATR